MYMFGLCQPVALAPEINVYILCSSHDLHKMIV